MSNVVNNGWVEPPPVVLHGKGVQVNLIFEHMSPRVR